MPTLKRFCTVKNMNYNGEVIHGHLLYSVAYGHYYMLADGDCYKPDVLMQFDVTFSDTDPRNKP